MNDDERKEEMDGFGLDKDSRLMERRERRDEENGPEPLDPPFPYRVIPQSAVVEVSPQVFSE